MNPDLPRSPAGDFNPWLITVILSLVPFMEVLDTTIANVSLTHIAGALGASTDESTWILTSYLVANSIVLPISGWLAKVIGRKRFYQICVALFTASSVLCAFSTSLNMIVIARVLQGLGGGGLAPATQSMLADTFPPWKRAKAFTAFGFTIILAPAIGPVIGGWITDNLSWHGIFLINLPVGLVASTLIAIFVSEPPLLIKERRELLAAGLKMDYVGLFLVVTGFGSLQIFLDKFQLDDGFTSPFIIGLFCAWFASLSTLVVWEWNHPQPVMNFRLFQSRNFAIACLVMALVGFIFLSSSQLLPVLAQGLLGYTSQLSGDMMALGGLATLIMMPIAGTLAGRAKQPKYLLMVAFLVMGTGLLSQSALPPDIGFWQLAMARVSQVFCMPLVFIPVQAVAYVGLNPRLNGDAAALLNQTRNIGGSVGISFVTAMVAWRTQFHHARLAESTTPYGSLHGLSVAAIAPIVQQQATFDSYLDVFWVLGTVALLATPLLMFLKPGPARRPA
jgi:DHA2 family multidrug resistance protein